MDSFAKARAIYQVGILILASLVGLLGFVGSIQERDYQLATTLGIASPMGFALSFWILRRAFARERGKGENSDDEEILEL